jgi:hypothetical protein
MFFVPNATNKVVIIKTIGVKKIPFGAKKCPINPLSMIINVANPIAILLFI